MTTMQTPFATTLEEQRKVKETREFMENLEELTESEMQQVKGIVIGIRLAKHNSSQRLQEV